MKKTLTYLILVLATLACNKENAPDCFKISGVGTTDTRYTAKFDSLEVQDKFDVSISNGSEYKVEVTAGKNLVKGIKTEVKNGQLIITNTNKCNFVRGYKHRMKVHITTPYIKKIYNNGVGPIRLDDNFKQDTLTVRAESSGDTYINGTFKVVYTSSHGNGDIYLSGSAKELLVYTNGTNYTHAENFSVSDHLFISTYSIGNSYLNLAGTTLFECYIWRAGNIYYTGNPVNFKNLSDGSGKGQVIKQD